MKKSSAGHALSERRESKGFTALYLVIILFVLGAIGGAYYFGKNSSTVITTTNNAVASPTQKPNQTSSQKTYTNTKYGYEFQYPADYYLEKSSNEVRGNILFSYQPPKTPTKDVNFFRGKLKVDFNVILSSERNGKSLKEWYQETESSGGSGMFKIISKEDTKVASKDAIKVVSEATGNQSLKMVTYYVENNDIVFLITGYGDFDKEHQEVFDQIISTFKFLDQNQADTSNWKTYTNNEQAYQFKYPEDWMVGADESRPFTLIQSAGELEWSLVVNYTSKDQLGLMGITYCGDHLEDKARCERFKISDLITAGIDWGEGLGNNAYATIGHPQGGVVSFDLKPVSPENKQLFYKILSTFKFN